MTMHVDFYNVYQRRTLKLADKIERLKPYQFNVSRWFSPSGAPSCIAAWTVAMFHGTPDRDMDIAGIAMMKLGLDLEQGHKLFTPRTSDIFTEGLFMRNEGDLVDHTNDLARHQITRDWAAATLRHLAATGVVDWHNSKPTRRPLRIVEQPRRVPEYISS